MDMYGVFYLLVQGQTVYIRKTTKKHVNEGGKQDDGLPLALVWRCVYILSTLQRAAGEENLCLN